MLQILGVREARRGRHRHSRDFGEQTTCPRIDAYIAPYDPRIDAYIAPYGPRIDAYIAPYDPRIDAYIAPYGPRIDAYIAPSGPRIDAYPMTDAGLVEPVRPLALGAGRAVAWPAAHAPVRVPCPTPR